MNVGVLQRSEHALNLPYKWGVRFSETNHGWGFFWLFYVTCKLTMFSYQKKHVERCAQKSVQDY